MIRSILLLGLATFTACQQGPAPEFRENSAEFLKQEKLELNDGEKFPQDYHDQVTKLVGQLFGSPNEPKIPVLLKNDDPASKLFDLDLLQMAAGAVASDRAGEPVGLYREHCAHCHGLSGDGAGSTAGFLIPYPRDFRLGKFKFKSTPLRTPPTKADLEETLRHGIPGTAMPSFQTLDQKETDALVQYVQYLSIRGQFERLLIGQLAGLDGESIPEMPSSDFRFDTAQSNSNNSDSEAADQELLAEFVYDNLIENELISRWLEAADNVTAVPPAPPSFDREHPDYSKLVDRGRALFGGKANCVQCHGATGLGDGQTENFDDWTKDWIATPGVDPDDKSTYREFLAAGKLKPKTIRPRNLLMPVFRGGGQSETLFRVIQNGIEGTPMPSSTILDTEEIWALVAFVKQLPYENRLENPLANEASK